MSIRDCQDCRKLRLACVTVICAAEIIDGQDCPPVTDDVEHLHHVIRNARNILSETE